MGGWGVWICLLCLVTPVYNTERFNALSDHSTENPTRGVSIGGSGTLSGLLAATTSSNAGDNRGRVATAAALFGGALGYVTSLAHSAQNESGDCEDSEKEEDLSPKPDYSEYVTVKEEKKRSDDDEQPDKEGDIELFRTPDQDLQERILQSIRKNSEPKKSSRATTAAAKFLDKKPTKSEASEDSEKDFIYDLTFTPVQERQQPPPPSKSLSELHPKIHKLIELIPGNGNSERFNYLYECLPLKQALDNEYFFTKLESAKTRLSSNEERFNDAFIAVLESLRTWCSKENVDRTDIKGVYRAIPAMILLLASSSENLSTSNVTKFPDVEEGAEFIFDREDKSGSSNLPQNIIVAKFEKQKWKIVKEDPNKGKEKPTRRKK